MLYGKEIEYIVKIKRIINKANATQEMTTAEIEKLEVYVQALLIERKVQALEK